MRLDCAPVRMRTWEELAPTWTARPARSAGSWRRCSACPGRQHADYGRLGLAFQLTNFLRDVREDYELDRIYLPAEDRERFGVAEADLDRRAATPELRALVAFEVAPRARAVRGRRAGASRPRRPSVRPGVRLACAAYLRRARPRRALASTCSAGRTGLRAWMLPGVVARALHR